jgi:hypothetical protein
MEWQTDKRLGVFFGVALILALLLFDTGVVLSLRTRAIDALTFFGGLAVVLSLPVLALVGYRLHGLLRSGYALDRNQLTIYWGSTRHIIPTREIEQMLRGEEVSARIRFRGGRWPGMWIGQGDVPEIGLTLFNATTPLDRQLLVVTNMAAYAISPIDRAGFIKAFEARYALGPTQEVRQGSIRPAYFEWEFWADRLAHRLILAAGVACAALFFYLSARFPELPARLALHFDVNGTPDRLGDTVELFIVPFIGLLAFGVNTALGVVLYGRERVASYLLWGGAGLIQGMLWVAALMLTR